MEDDGLRSVGWEVGEDIEQVLAADAETLDAVTTAPDTPASSSA
jgi:hypothetical protein